MSSPASTERAHTVAEYKCWLFRSVLLQGFMYLTTGHICFYAYLPRKEVRQSLPHTASDSSRARSSGPARLRRGVCARGGTTSTGSSSRTRC